MGVIKQYASVSLANFKISVLTALEYPANLLGWLLSNPIQFIVGFATIKFVVSEFGTINGWDYGQLAFLYGIAIISHGLSMILFVQGWFMGYFVIEGEFDRYMLRPMSVLYQFFFTNFNAGGFTDLIPGIFVFDLILYLHMAAPWIRIYGKQKEQTPQLLSVGFFVTHRL